MSFDFDYLEDLKQRQIEDDEELTPDEDSYDEKDEEDEEAPIDDFEDEVNHYADFIRDIVHPDLCFDDVVAEIDVLDEEIVDHILSTDALVLEDEQLIEDIQDSDDLVHQDTDEVFSEQSFEEIIAEVQELEPEFIEQFDQDSDDNLLEDSSNESLTDVEVTQESLSQLLLLQREEVEVQDANLPVIEDEIEEDLKEADTQVVEVEEVDTDDTADQFQTMDLSTPSEQVISDDFTDLQDLQEHQDLQELQEKSDINEIKEVEDIEDIEEIVELKEYQDLQTLPEEPSLIDFRDIQDENNLLDLQTIQDLITEHQALRILDELKELDEVDELNSLENSDDIVSLEETELSLEKTTPDVEDSYDEPSNISLDEVLSSLPIFSSLEPINESELLKSLSLDRVAIVEDLNSPIYQDPDKLSLNELNEYTQKQSELGSLQEFIELVPLYSQMDKLTGKDFLVFEDEFLFQEYVSTLFDTVNEFSSQSVATESDPLIELLPEVDAPHFLHEFRPDLPRVSHGPYIVEPPPYNYLEELETLYAQSDQAAPRSSDNIVDNFEKGRETQLKATIDSTKTYSDESSKINEPSFRKRISAKKDRKTGIKNPWGDIMLPKKFLEETLPNRFPGFQQGDLFQVEITNLRTKSGIHTCKVSRRIQFTQHLSEYFDYRIGDLLEIKFQQHIPQSMIGNYQSPVTSIARFVQYSKSNMVNVQLTKTVMELLNLRINSNSVSNLSTGKLHWRFKYKEGVSSNYKNKTIGITPTSLGLKSRSQNFCDQITIISPNLLSAQIDMLTEGYRSEFATKELNIFKEATGIRFTGKSKSDKEPMMEFVVTCLVEENLFDDVEEIGFHVPIKDPEGKEISKQFAKPDGLLKRINNPQPELVEEKAFKSKGKFNIEKTCDQLRKYRSLGYRVNLITTLNRRDIPRSIQELCDKIYAYEDLAKMIAKSKNTLLEPMVKSIRKSWP